MAAPGNCGTADWPASVSGLRPPGLVSAAFGSEFRPSLERTLTFELQGRATYTTAGRYYNELSELTQKILATSEFLQLGGKLAVHAGSISAFRISVFTEIFYNTEHLLTDESLGRDLNGNGGVDLSETREINPNFDNRYDMVSRRFRIEESLAFDFGAQLALSF
jgi:hypothetical protein